MRCNCLPVAVVLVIVVMDAMTNGEMVDLTHHTDKNGRTFPLNKQFEYTDEHRGPWKFNPNLWLENEAFRMPSHFGTHMDAPSHFCKGGKTVDEIAPSMFFSRAVVIDHTERAKIEVNDAITVLDLMNWEQQYGRIPDGAIILSKTGYSLHYYDPPKYFGNPNPEKWPEAVLNYPAFSGEAAAWLTANRKIFMAAVDVLSIDIGNSSTFPAHVAFCKADVLMIENVGTGIEKIPVDGSATVITLPMKNRGASGAPVRMLAVWGDSAAKFMITGSAPKQNVVCPLIFFSFIFIKTFLAIY